MATGVYRDYGYRPGNRNPSHAYLLPVLDRMLEASPGPVLDIGCGEGDVAKALIRRGHDVFGVDASESGIQLASMDAPGRFFVMDIESGRLPANLAGIRFSTVISVEVIEHLYAPRSLPALARTVLAPGGDLIISTPYHGYVKYLLLAVSGTCDLIRDAGLATVGLVPDPEPDRGIEQDADGPLREAAPLDHVLDLPRLFSESSVRRRSVWACR